MPRIELVEKYTAKGIILDVGCAIGNFLECVVRNPNWEAYGVEPNKFAAGFAKENVKATIYDCMLEETDFKDESFDVVTLWETIEHLQKPLELLKYCYRLIKKGGLFFISTPNVGGFEFKMIGKDHFNIGAPSHLNYFDTKTIIEILNRAGFAEISIITPGKLDVENVRALLKQGKGLEKAGEFMTEMLLSDEPESELFRKNLQTFISENNLSGNMVAICKKYREE
jgi:SAM-dependent methyltransferase